MYQLPREDGLVCVCIAITVYIGLLYPMSTTVKIWPWEPSVYYSSLRVCWPGKFLLHRMVINKTFILRFKKINSYHAFMFWIKFISKNLTNWDLLLDKSFRCFVIGLVILHFLICFNNFFPDFWSCLYRDLRIDFFLSCHISFHIIFGLLYSFYI